MIQGRPDRRSILKAAAAAGAWLGGAALASAGSGPPPQRRTRHVVVVAFAGGVRTRETFGTPANVPALRAMAAEGVLYTRMRTANLGHFGATLSLFTGISEARGIRENARGDDPTLFEYARKHGGLAAEDVWIATSGGTQQTNYSHGLHPDYGARYGANILDGDGIFNREFKRVLAALGKPRERSEREEELLRSMRGAIGVQRAGTAVRQGLEESENAARVERYLLDELARGTADLRGVAAPDTKALRVARNLVALFKPRLTAVVLQSADVAHGSFNSYVEVIRQNDAALGELWSAVKADPELAETTAFLVLPEFGRDADLNSRRGLDHGDGSSDLQQVAGVCWGPDFRRGLLVQEEVQTIDLAPTVCALLGVQARHAKGRVLPRLWA